MRGNTLSLVLVLAGGIAASGCGENPVPTFPSYARDIQPMMTAHCTRCHSNGGMIDPLIPPDATATAAMTKLSNTKPHGDFTTYQGVAAYTGPTKIIMDMYLPSMPPPPSDALSGWELDTLQAWLSDPRP